MKNILILSSTRAPEETLTNDNWVNKLNLNLKGKAKIVWCNYHNIRVDVTSNNLSITLISSGENIGHFDFVYFKSIFRNTEVASIIANYLVKNKIPFASTEVKNHNIATKLSQYSRLSNTEIPLINTIFMQTEELLNSFDECKNRFGVPFILKAIDGSLGRDNFLINSEEEFRNAMSSSLDLHFIAQEFIPNDCDYRVLIVDGQIKLIIKRARITEGTHLNNTSQGAKAELISQDDISNEIKNFCIKSAKLIERETAGVDLMFNKNTGEPYIIEVNASPQIASGAFTDEKLAIFTKYFEEVISGGR